MDQKSNRLEAAFIMAKYSYELKKKIVDQYLNGNGGFAAITKQYSVPYTVVRRWVHTYTNLGEDGLKSHKKGRKPKPGPPPMNKDQNEKQTIETADDNAKHIKELEDENYHLRLENAILKKTRRLRLEEEAKSRKRESSTAYDKNSN